MQTDVPYFWEAVVGVLALGSLRNPFASAIALVLLLVCKVIEGELNARADRAGNEDLSAIKADLSKLKAKAEQENLTKAFVR